LAGADEVSFSSFAVPNIASPHAAQNREPSGENVPHLGQFNPSPGARISTLLPRERILLDLKAKGQCPFPLFASAFAKSVSLVLVALVAPR
jgi:hypothetical protein